MDFANNFLTGIFNIFPYLITGNIAAFNDGIRHNSQELCQVHS